MEKTIRITSSDVISLMLRDLSLLRYPRILEPSAGTGNLARGIIDKFPYALIDCCELNKEMRDFLVRSGYTVIGEDFMRLEINPIYDAVIAAPPFKDNVDVEHIMRMYEFLNANGTLVSLTHPAWTLRDGVHQKKFRHWLTDKRYVMRMLPDKSFVENYETQPTMIIQIYKKGHA